MAVGMFASNVYTNIKYKNGFAEKAPQKIYIGVTLNSGQFVFSGGVGQSAYIGGEYN